VKGLFTNGELDDDTEVLVNTSDAVVKRVTAEKGSHDRACARALERYNALIASYDAVFVDRVGKILQDVEVQLPALPQWFSENTESPQ
jgi:hypothetical protein